MILRQFDLSTDWLAPGAVLTNVVLDTSVHVTSLNHPALIPYVESTAGTRQLGDALQAGTSTPVVTLNGGNAWYLVDQILVTAQAGDTLSFSTTAAQVIWQLTGVLMLGMVRLGGTHVDLAAIRNGGIVQLLVDGTLAQSLDLAFASPQLIWTNPDGASHTLELLVTGVSGQAVQPLGPIVALSGTSVANGLSLQLSTTQITLTAASWRLVATSGTTYSLYTTPQGGTETLVASSLTTGTVYDAASAIPGVRFSVTGTLLSGDQARVTTDVVLTGVQWLQVNTGTGALTGSYTTPVLDGGQYTLQWYLATLSSSDLLTGATSPAQARLTCGDTPTPDATWTITDGRFVDAVLAGAVPPTRIGQTAIGFLGGAAADGVPMAGRGRYAQLTFVFPGGLQATSWIADMALYAWEPEADIATTMKWPVPPTWTPDLTLTAMVGALAAAMTGRTRQRFLDLANSMAISTATSAYLQVLGDDLGIAPYVYTLIPPQAYALLLRSISGSQVGGGSVASLATELATLVGGVTPITTTSVTASFQTASALSAPMSGPVVVTQTAPWQIAITIPSATTTGYPGLAYMPILNARQIIRALIAVLAPAATISTITFR